MIKVMHVLTDTNIGGAGIWLCNFLRSSITKKYDIVAVLPEKAVLTPRIRALGVRVIELKTIGDRSFSFESVREIYRVVKKEKPQIVHTHASLSARIASRLNGVSIVHTRHCIEEKKSFPKNLVYRFVNNVLSDKVIGVSKAVTDNLRSDGINEKKLSLVYNGIKPLNEYPNEEKNKMKEKFSLPPTSTVVGLVARLEDVKDPLLFVRAAKILEKDFPDVRFLMVGEGSLKKEVEKAVAPLKSKITMAGYLENVEEAYNAMDILTLTSKSEALSISLSEGQSIGLPAVSTDSGGTREVIEDGVNGFLVPVGDEISLAEAISLLIRNPEKRKEMGMAGKKIVIEKFGLETMSQSIDSIYKNLCKEVTEK